METILAGVAMFCAIVVVLVALILIARKFLVQSGDIKIGVNGDPDKTLTCPAGGKLLNDLSERVSSYHQLVVVVVLAVSVKLR